MLTKVTRGLGSVLLLASATAAFAIDPQVLALISAGDTRMAAGDTAGATIDYNNAMNKAADLKDWDGLLNVTDRYLKVGDSDMAKRTFLLARDDAEFPARHASDFDDPDQACADGINQLRRVSLFWSTDLSTLAMTPAAMTDMSGVGAQADKSANDYQASNCR